MLALLPRLAALLALLLALSIPADALPTMRTYRGVSPYKALAEGGLYPERDPNRPLVQVLNPHMRHPKENWNPRRACCDERQWRSRP